MSIVVNSELIKNIDLEEIKIVGNSYIEFLLSYKGKPTKKIICNEIWKFDTSFISDVGELPIFIADIKINRLNENNVNEYFRKLQYGFIEIPISELYFVLEMHSGDININVLCRKIKVINL